MCAIVRLDGGRVTTESLTRMCELAAHRGRDGQGAWADESVGIGQLAHWVRPVDRGVVDPLAEPDLVVGADCRIDNRGELAARLGVPAGTTDLGLVAAAYRRWGERFPAELLGDFAIVVWDRARRRITLARDPMGMRALYFLHEPGRRLLAGSEVAQIVGDPDVRAEIDELQLAAFLHGPYGFRERSFHRGVGQVAPGEVVVVDLTGPARRARFWDPDPENRLRLADEREYAEALRELLVDAVRVRCDGVQPPSLLLSGGADSGSVAVSAGTLARRGEIEPPLIYSWAFDELPTCDERAVSEPIARHYELSFHGVPGDDAFPLADFPGVGPKLDSPASWPWTELNHRTYERLARDGVSVVMTAGRGDEVIGDPVWDYAGLLAARRFRDAGRRLRGSATAAGRPWWQVARGALAIELRRSPNLDRPALGPELRGAVDIEELWRGEVRRTTVVKGRGQQLRYGRIFGYAAQQLTALDAREVAGHGMVLVDPFTDRRVVEWVLSIPQYEVTRPDRPKHLLRAAVRPWMPPGLEFLSGADLSALYARGLFDRRRSLVERLFATSELAARGYIRGEAYEEMYSELRAGKPRVLFEWALAAELWVRRHWSTDRRTP